MTHFSTLRVRFAFWVAILLLGALIVFGVFVYVSLSRSLHASVDDSLQLSAAQAIAAVNVENGELSISDSIPETSAIAGLRGGRTLPVTRAWGLIEDRLSTEFAGLWKEFLANPKLDLTSAISTRLDQLARRLDLVLGQS